MAGNKGKTRVVVSTWDENSITFLNNVKALQRIVLVSVALNPKPITLNPNP